MHLIEIEDGVVLNPYHIVRIQRTGKSLFFTTSVDTHRIYFDSKEEANEHYYLVLGEITEALSDQQSKES